MSSPTGTPYLPPKSTRSVPDEPPGNPLARTWWYWIVGGAVYGVLLRWLFGWAPGFVGAMSFAFLFGTPFAVGALTVYGARDQPRSWWFVILGPWLTVLLMLAGCAIAMLEGMICIALLLPLFLTVATIGGVTMHLVLPASAAHHSQLKAVAALPFLLMLVEGHVPLRDNQLEVRHAVEVNATPQAVWKEILTARDIRPGELPLSLTHLIGVPRPLEGINFATPEGEVRQSKWERGVSFRARVTQRKEHESITWRYAFDPHSFPPGSMDEHVAIGGRYFDLYDTTFSLQPLPGGRTRLEIVAHYRVSSAIDFYAVPAARVLGRDFVAMILGLYKGRAERAEKQK